MGIVENALRERLKASSHLAVGVVEPELTLKYCSSLPDVNSFITTSALDTVIIFIRTWYYVALTTASEDMFCEIQARLQFEPTHAEAPWRDA